MPMELSVSASSKRSITGAGVAEPRHLKRPPLTSARRVARTLAAGVVVLVSCAGAAQAHSPSYVPPGDSSAIEYIETLPTAGGGIPTQGVHRYASSGFTQGEAGGGTTASNGAPAVNRRTLRALEHAGRVGASAALLALATGQARMHLPAAGHGSGEGDVTKGEPAVGAQVFDAVTGSLGNSGLGALLPAILVATAIAGVAVALRTRRNSGGR